MGDCRRVLSMALTTPSALVSLLGTHGAGLGQGQFLAIPGISDNPGLNSNVSVPSSFDGLCSTRVSADGQVVATMLLRPGFVGGFIEPRGGRWSQATGTVAILP